jgi:translation initiation factor 1A
MYQASIRNKKKTLNLSKSKNINYIINPEYEDYGFVIKLLGNCRASILCNNGDIIIGIIRGNMRRFNKRVLIGDGDIVVVSRRDYQVNKADIVHKYNLEQCQYIINSKEISETLINAYYKNNNKTCDSVNIETYISFEEEDIENKENLVDNFKFLNIIDDNEESYMDDI